MMEYDRTNTVNFAEEFYKKKIVYGAIENYWKTKDPPPSAESSHSITVCLDKSEEWKKFFEDTFSKAFQREATENFRNMDVLCKELKNLLPENDTEEIESILPVLITSYIQNKKGNDGFARRLIDEGFDENFDYHKKVEIFTPQRWEKRYSSLKASDCKESSARRIFPVFFNAVMFLFFLLKTKELCNIGLSFYIYDCLTGYLRLLSSQSEKLIDYLSQVYSTGNVTTDHVKDDEITNLAELLLEDFQLIPDLTKTQIQLFEKYCKTHKIFKYPLSLYTFAGRVGSSLSPEFMPDDSDSVLDGKDIVKIALYLDTDFVNGQRSIVSEMPKTTQKHLEKYLKKKLIEA